MGEQLQYAPLESASQSLSIARVVGSRRQSRSGSLQLKIFVSPHTDSACPEIVAARGLAR